MYILQVGPVVPISRVHVKHNMATMDEELPEQNVGLNKQSKGQAR